MGPSKHESTWARQGRDTGREGGRGGKGGRASKCKQRGIEIGERAGEGKSHCAVEPGSEALSRADAAHLRSGRVPRQ